MTLPADARRERAVVVGLLALAVVTVLWRPLLAMGSFAPNDIALLHQPWVEDAPAGYEPDNQALGDVVNSLVPAEVVLRRALADGDLPLWNPLVGLGTPLAASLTKPILSPLTLPHLILPLWYGTGVSALLRLVLLVGGTYLFARRLGLRPAAAGVAAASFGFCGFNTAWLSFPQTYVTAFLPVALLAAERALRSGSAAAAGAVAFATFALVTGAFPFVTALCLATVVAWLAVRVRIGVPAAGPAPLRHAAVGAVGVGLGLVMALALVLPLRAELDEANLAYYRNTTYADALPAGTAWRLLVPNLYGRGNDYFGDINAPETATYVGMVPLVAALSVPFVRRRRAMGLTFLVGGAALFALAYQTPVWRLLDDLPLLDTNPTGRVSSVAAFAVAMAAAFAVDGWFASRDDDPIPDRSSRRRLVAVTAGAAAGAVAIVWVGRSVVDPSGATSDAAISVARREVAGGAVLGVAAVAALVAARKRLVAAPALALVAVGLTVAELLRLAVPTHPVTRRADFLPSSTAIDALPTDATRVAGVELVGYPSLLGAYRVADLRAHKLPSLEERALYAALDPNPQPSPTYFRLSYESDFASPLLPLLGVSHVVAPLGQEPLTATTDVVAAPTERRLVLGPRDEVRLRVQGPATGVGLFVDRTEPAAGVPREAGRVPDDPARLRAELRGPGGVRRTAEVGFAWLPRLGRVAWVFPPVGAGEWDVRIRWTEPPRAASPVTLTAAADGSPAFAVYRPGPLRAVHTSDAVVYAVPDPAPQAALYTAWRRGKAVDAPATLARGAVDGRRTVLVDRNPGIPARPGPSRALDVDRPDHDRVRVRLPRDHGGGVVVLRDGWAPGWRASVDGRRVPVLRAQGVLRGVAVPPGARAVTFSYVPDGWPWALWISLAAALVALGLVAPAGVRRLQRRSNSD